MLHEVKYLGVILDSKVYWNQHLQKIIRKTQTTFALVRHTCGKKWGLRPGMVHWLYTRVIRPFLFLWCFGLVTQGHAKNHQKSTRQDSENGLSNHYGGYEIDPNCSNGDASESDSARSLNHGGGEDDTL